ncbi:MAG: site-specific integrase [Desulfotalea sp.]
MASARKVTTAKGIAWVGRARISGHKEKVKRFQTKGEAYSWAVEYETLLRRKIAGDPDLAKNVFLDDALVKYAVDGKTEGKKPSTLDLEKRASKHLLRILRPNISLAEISGPLVSQYIQRRQKEGYSSSAIRQELAILSKMFDNARKIWGLNIDNPVDLVKRPSPGKGSERVLSVPESKIVLQIARESRNKKFGTYVLLLLHTGMRSSEVASLHPDRVDTSKRFVRLIDTKTNKPRTVPLTQTAADALALIPVEPDSGYYFLKDCHLKAKSTQLKPADIFNSCWKSFKIRLKREHPNFLAFRPHDLRHTAASHLLMAGVDIREVADILGHSTLAMAMRYTHLLDDYRQNVVDKIEHLGG